MFVAPFRKSYAHYHTRVIRTKDQRLSWFFGCLNTLLNPKNWELSINLGRAGDPSKKPFSVSGSESLAQHAADFGPGKPFAVSFLPTLRISGFSIR